MNKTKEVTIGDRLKMLREDADLTQTELARELHVRHNGVISMYENGKKNLSIEMLLMYSEYFRVTTDWILKGEPATSEDDKGLNGLGGLEEIKKVYLSIRRPEVRQVAIRQLRNLAILG
ncbi:helix-turn-helix domain-containing protein [Butyrivibrio sp. AE3004]|uniref:helix-turn-helix domain-containing protein n=1 Tax=Butyrivibrio sp. AE3004 TaxID=1506994 RepID=UPI00068B1C8C|nr:helix-turn-helix transcriptional regulator [Butyrivibrio sp. AE3004]